MQLKELRKSGAPKSLLLLYYKTFIQQKIDYGISVWGCTTDYNLKKIQRIQNRAARHITGNYNFRTVRGIDLVKQLRLESVAERRDYFLSKLMFEAIHGFTRDYLRHTAGIGSHLSLTSWKNTWRPQIKSYTLLFHVSAQPRPIKTIGI